MYRMTKIAVIGIFLLASALLLSGCNDSASKSQDNERAAVAATYDGLVSKQPAESMTYSPTRETKNFWIRTWNEPGKLAYVYLQAADGKMLGYYVLKGLPVSYCTSLVPTFQVETYGGNTNPILVPRSSVDGTYSSGSNCNTYYGQDATTGAYIEYTAGMGINVLLFDKPMPRLNAQPLGDTTI